MYVTLIVPILKRLKERLEKKRVGLITITFSLFMVFNIVISCIAAERQEQRRKNVEAKSSLDTFLDTYYPDEYMDKVYANKKDR